MMELTVSEPLEWSLPDINEGTLGLSHITMEIDAEVEPYITFYED